MRTVSAENIEKDNPRANAKCLSAVTFWYTLPLFHEGRRREITEEDLTRPLDIHKSHTLGDKIAKVWSRECDSAKKQKRRPSMTKVIWLTFYDRFLLYGFVLFCAEIFVRLSLPLFVGNYIKYFSELNRNKTAENGPTYSPTYHERLWHYWMPDQCAISEGEAYFYGTGIVVTSAVVIMTFHPFMMAVLHIGMRIRIACCSLIYRKALRIKLTSLGGKTVGNVVNLMSNDVNRFDMAPMFLHYLWIAPLQALCIMYFMYLEMGNSGLRGFLAIGIFLPIQIFFGVNISYLRRKSGYRTDERVRQMNEVIQSMQVIKMYAWEHAFAVLIGKLRRRELSVLIRTSYIRGMIMSLIMFTTRSAILLTVIEYVTEHGTISPDKVFMMTAYYQILRTTMTMYFPQGVALISETCVSIKRIEEFMMTEETEIGDPTPIDPDWMDKPKKYRTTEDQKLMAGEIASIKLLRVSAKYGDEECLNNITMDVVPGKLTAVVGLVGAGKSCLLNVILGELEITEGKVVTRGTIAFASQEPWLFAGSVRQNILVGREFDMLRYRETLKVCCLVRDLQLLPYGDRTIVGERGISLSGGQRARVNLARAIYSKADIYLLDDPLSAVDIQVGTQLFQDCIKTYLRNKVVILVTHQLQYLKDADQIVVLQEGRMQMKGTYAEVSRGQGNIAALMKEASSKKEDDADVVIQRINLTSQMFNSMIDIEGRKAKPRMVAEMRTHGGNFFTNYISYFSAGGNCCVILIMVLFFLGAQACASGGDFFLSKWIDVEELRTHYGDASSMGRFNDLSRQDYIEIYTIIMIVTIVVAVTRSIVFFTICMRASMRLHNDMFRSVIHATMYFFNTNTSGRILNRFSKDLGAVDELLPNAFIDTVQLLLNLLGAVVVIIILEPLLAIPTAFMFIGFFMTRMVYVKTSKSLKRLEGITRSPVFAHLNASLQGLTTIRSNGQEQIFVSDFDAIQDVHSSAWYMFLSTSVAFGFWIDLICTGYIAFVTFIFVVLSESHMGSVVGLAVTQCMGLSGLLQWGMRQSAELTNQMTAVERVVEYTKIEHEDDLESKPEFKPKPDWPKYGRIEYIDASMKYSKNELPVLRNLNLVIYPREKIGIVGRTGAGKSSLISTLFRLAYIQGTILIDYVNITELGLHDLRKKISIIPQEPVLFSGSLRYNLDPFNEYSDKAIFNALMDVELRNAVLRGTDCLSDAITEAGSNFSVGQRQMICLARAILRNNVILIMDEATANVDAATDKFVQKTIRTKFAHCTVLTIAHRLHTVMDSDKILVMDAGQIAEFDHPHILLQNKNSIFFDLVKKTGPGTADVLTNMAKDSYQKKKNNK